MQHNDITIYFKHLQNPSVIVLGTKSLTVITLPSVSNKLMSMK